MPIIPPLSDNDVTEELKTVFEKSKKGSGSSNMLQTYAHNPEFMQAFLQYYGALWKGEIDPVLKEMIRYRIAIAGECGY
ncbi:carboxymuconolactone decarboxylase family protein [Anaerobacillus sp. MEB173]|uniref:carboxymuconolactone decarboxylase family protein n=1 Tax=Anaerobacillus sp. MEB173 TaxID=3383345 RepID=UPI003F9277A9